MKEMKGNRRRGLPGIVWSEAERGEEDAARGLTPERLDAIMLEANSGDPRRQARLCRDILERDWSIAQALQTRVNAVLGCEWHLEAGDDGEAAKAAADALERQLRDAGAESDDGLEVMGVDGLIEELMGALLPGYAVVEKCWRGGGDLAGFSAVPQTAVTFLKDGRPRILVEGEPEGIELERGRYIWHRAVRRGNDPARGGLVRPLAWLFCLGNIAVKDLAGFVERHGMPFIVGKVDQAGVEQERNAVKRLIRNFGPSGGGVFSRNVEVQLMESTSRGEVYFSLLQYLDDAVTKVVLGQTASSGDSAGLSKGDAQSKVRQDILEADCRRVAACIQRQVVPQWMAYNAPGVALPRFVLEYEAPEDRVQLAQTVAALAQAGFKADADELSERFGMKLVFNAPQSAGTMPGGMAMGGEDKAAPERDSEAAKGLRKMEMDIERLADSDDPEEFREMLSGLLADSSDAEAIDGLGEAIADLEATAVAAGAAEADRRLAEAARKAHAKKKGK